MQVRGLGVSYVPTVLSDPEVDNIPNHPPVVRHILIWSHTTPRTSHAQPVTSSAPAYLYPQKYPPVERHQLRSPRHPIPHMFTAVIKPGKKHKKIY